MFNPSNRRKATKTDLRESCSKTDESLPPASDIVDGVIHQTTGTIGLIAVEVLEADKSVEEAGCNDGRDAQKPEGNGSADEAEPDEQVEGNVCAGM